MDGEAKNIPPVHDIMDTPEAHALEALCSREGLRCKLRAVLDALRSEVMRGALKGDREALKTLALARLRRVVTEAHKPLMRRVINATGVILHTNLGRAPLGESIAQELACGALGYAALEYDLSRGERGQRDRVIAPRITELLGAEDAVVVNNNAAAVLLVATVLGAGREVVVSRGELVEIGGGFRIPEVMESCGARLIEVGTTNRTHPRDYARVICERTAMLLRVHRSNFVQSGFCCEVSREDLVALGREHKVLVIEDLGSGAMVDTRRYGIGHEPTPRESLEAGMDLVLFSGDKLMGGPQAGLIAGRAELVEKLRRHPLMRALRPGRLVLSALEMTLRAYTEGRAERDVAVLRALSEQGELLRVRASKVHEGLMARGLSGDVRCEVVKTEGRVGGGAMPAARLVSYGLKVTGTRSVRLSRALREGDPAVVARIEDDAVILDVLTVSEAEVAELVEAVWAGLSAKETQHELAEGRETSKISGEHDEE